MHIDILTLFPRVFEGPFDESIIRRARDRHLVGIAIHDLRDYTHDTHHTVDDYPYGGGAGMLLKPEPLFEAIEAITASPSLNREHESCWKILLTPQGRVFSQDVAQELAARSRLLMVCGHYEGVDERVREHMVDDEISIGDYVLSGGEFAAMVLVDAIVRLLPDALGSEDANKEDSHIWGMLEYPQYTRPRVYQGWEVPSVLISGNHAEIAKWRREQALKRTQQRRPDIAAKLQESQLNLPDSEEP
ncbi:MAG: tRNA (guanosine(37)-N1)-methyltransferase TrmD [Chloroflexota bacterium]|nr:tRNA (guanosine(37)-N1)-methyltransferase TrmD [Chloroflexota bacterium]